ILSQLGRGAVEVLVGELADESTPDAARALRRALRGAADAGYEAVARPVEGTMLTVARVAAEAAEAAQGDVAAAVRAVAHAAHDALDHTPEQLETLRRAGVVDAGG